MALEEHCTRAADGPFADACQDEVGEGPVPGKCCAGEMQAFRPSANHRKVRPSPVPAVASPPHPVTASFLKSAFQLNMLIQCCDAEMMLRCDLRDLPKVERRVMRMSHTPDAVRLRRKIEAEVDLRANPLPKAQLSTGRSSHERLRPLLARGPKHSHVNTAQFRNSTWTEESASCP